MDGSYRCYGSIKTNIIVVRSPEKISDEIKNKISLFCDVPKSAIVQSENVDFIYEVLTHEKDINDTIQKTKSKNVDIIPANSDLCGLEIEPIYIECWHYIEGVSYIEVFDVKNKKYTMKKYVR